MPCFWRVYADVFGGEHDPPALSCVPATATPRATVTPAPTGHDGTTVPADWRRRGRHPACFEAPAVRLLGQPGEEAPPCRKLKGDEHGGGEVVERSVAQGLVGSTRGGEQQVDCRVWVEREREDRLGTHRLTSTGAAE